MMSEFLQGMIGGAVLRVILGVVIGAVFVATLRWLRHGDPDIAEGVRELIGE